MQKRPTLSDIFPLPNETKQLQIFLGNWTVEGILKFVGRSFAVNGVAMFSEVAAGWGNLSQPS